LEDQCGKVSELQTLSGSWVNVTILKYAQRILESPVIKPGSGSEYLPALTESDIRCRKMNVFTVWAKIRERELLSLSLHCP
jgi:hypothetical protein